VSDVKGVLHKADRIWKVSLCGCAVIPSTTWTPLQAWARKYVTNYV